MIKDSSQIEEITLNNWNEFMPYERKTIYQAQRTQEEVSQSYLSMLQCAKFEDFSKLQLEKFLVTLGTDPDGCKIVALFGNHFAPELEEKLFYYFITVMDAIVESKYYLLYFNTGVSSLSKAQVAFLRRIFYTLPDQYMKNLGAFYVIQPSVILELYLFLTKTFSTSANNLSLKAFSIHSQVSELDLLKHCPGWEKFIPSNILPLVVGPPKDLIKKNGVKEGPRKLCGIPLSEYPLSEGSGLPNIILLLTSYFDVKPDAYKTEQIFRVPGAITEEQELEKCLTNDDSMRVYSIKDPNVIACLFKKVLREMTEPVLPFEQFELVKSFSKLNPQEKDALAGAMIDSLPDLNKRVFFFILRFLITVLSYSAWNKMTANAMAIVFAPAILRPKAYDQSTMQFVKSPAIFMEHVLTYPEKFLPSSQ